MRITVKTRNTIIQVSEMENGDDPNKTASMRFADQNKHIQETIAVICTQIAILEKNTGGLNP